MCWVQPHMRSCERIRQSMTAFLWSQVTHRPTRSLILTAGILVAAISFTLLTAAASTSELRVTGTVARNFRPAYDILVRPPDSFTPLERRRGLIQENYLSGIFGGISLQQYREIRGIPGVEVAAPIANVGYIMPYLSVPLIINRYLSRQSTQMYRLRLEWSANGRLSTYPDNLKYVYFTRSHRFVRSPHGGPPDEVLPGDRLVSPCLNFNKSHPDGPLSPFQLVYQTGLTCLSAKTPELQGGIVPGILPPGKIGQELDVFLPVFVAAIDPAQEERLVGFDSALLAGRTLGPADRPLVRVGANGARYLSIPVMTSARTYVDETLHVTIERLRLPSASALYRAMGSDRDAWRFVRSLPVQHVVGTERIPMATIFRAFLDRLSLPTRRITESTLNTYWRTSPTRYRAISEDRLEAVPTNSNENAFFGYLGLGWAPIENDDVQYRVLTRVPTTSAANNGEVPYPLIHVIGRFDPTKLPGFSALSRVPLETYYPPEVEAADRTSRSALGDRPLLPTVNLGGYIAQPPLMLTTLQGLRAFTNPRIFQAVDPRAPISVIRVRVSGVAGPDPLSRERIKNVAQAIHQRTGLAVDITAGSSPRPMVIQLPAGRYGQPPLLVREGWVQKGVAVRFLDALDRKSLALFTLILVVCGFFLANGALASVRSRRAEIGTMSCVGWSQRAIFAAVLGEVAAVGAAAGVVGTLLATGLVQAFSLHLSAARTVLVAPVAVLLAVAAGLLPAWHASRGVPMDAIRPAVSERAGPGTAGRIAWMALRNLRRVPSRTLLGAAGLFVGVGALTILVAINRAFHGVLVGTLLGNVISVRVRGVDVGSVVLVMLLGGLSVADILFLNLKERQAEVATIKTVGWDSRYLRWLIMEEGLAIGVAGSLAGVAVGVTLASFIRGIPLSSVALAASVAAVSGTAVAVLASLAPLPLLERLTPPTVLAEE